jgi:DNA ligase-1
MVKVKPTMEPLDLVVTRAMWGEGRRSDWLGRLYLACRDGEDLREVGRMSSGVTDAQLQELTAELEPLVERESGREVGLRPEVVLEVEYEEIQESPTYGSGYALRFPRFLRRREDLGPEGADSLDRVRALYEAQ